MLLPLETMTTREGRVHAEKWYHNLRGEMLEVEIYSFEKNLS